MDEVSLQERNLHLLERVQSGDASAEEDLIRENLGLVRKIAMRFLIIYQSP